MSDILTRLRNWVESGEACKPLIAEAAEEVERLRKALDDQRYLNELLASHNKELMGRAR